MKGRRCLWMGYLFEIVRRCVAYLEVEENWPGFDKLLWLPFEGNESVNHITRL